MKYAKYSTLSEVYIYKFEGSSMKYAKYYTTLFKSTLAFLAQLYSKAIELLYSTLTYESSMKSAKSYEYSFSSKAVEFGFANQ